MSGYSDLIDRAVQKSSSAIRASTLGHSEAQEELWDVWNECRSPDWDGYGAIAVEQDTYRTAYMLIDSLPLNFWRPTIAAEPDGQITLEWRKSPTRQLSVSVDPDGVLHYAGIFGGDKLWGTLTLVECPPRQLLSLVRKL